MRSYVQKNIMIEPELWEHTKIYAEITKDNISAVIRKAVEAYLKVEAENNLFYKMRTLTPTLKDQNEEEEIIKIVKEIYSKPIEIDESETITIEV